MASFNKVLIIGNLTRDPELRYTPKGTAVTKISLAINRQWKDESGQAKDEVTFVDVDVWGRTAENTAQYCKKGSSVLVEGRLKLDQWEDKNTKQKVSKLGVTAEFVTFISTPGERSKPSAPREEAPQQRNLSEESRRAADADLPPQEPDDVPF